MSEPIIWTEELAGDKYMARFDDGAGLGPRRAHILVIHHGDKAGAWWWVDGDDDMRRADDLQAAKQAAETELLRGLGGFDAPGSNGAGAETDASAAEPAGVLLVHGEEGGDRSDVRVTDAAARAVGLAVEEIERATPAEDDLPFEATGDISRRSLKRTHRANLRTHPMGESTPETYAARSLMAHLAEAGPAEIRRSLDERLERVQAFAASVRAFAEEDGAAGSELVDALLAEADGAALDLAAAADEVLRALNLQLATAEAVCKVYREEADAARSKARAIEARIERIKEQILRPVCKTAGHGDTRRLDLPTGTEIAIHRNPPKVDLEEGFDPSLLPEQFQRVKIEPDREAIRAALVEGQRVPGAFLVVSSRVVVR